MASKWDKVKHLIQPLAESGVPIRPRGRYGYNREAEEWVESRVDEISALMRNKVIVAAKARRILDSLHRKPECNT